MTAILKVQNDTSLQDALCKTLQRSVEWENNNFLPNLDSSHRLLPFKCGTVYDTRTQATRSAEPSDLISVTFNIKWADVPAAPSQEFNNWADKMWIDAAERHYHLCLHATTMVGKTGHQHGIFMHGGSKNGKSCHQSLDSYLFGEFKVALSGEHFTALTGGNPEQASPFLNKVMGQGCRMVEICELPAGRLGYGAVLNCRLFKQLTGGDPLPTRDLYAGSAEIIQKPADFTMVFTMNRPPHIPPEERVPMARRIANAPYDSVFWTQGTHEYRNNQIGILPNHFDADPRMMGEEWRRRMAPSLARCYIDKLRNLVTAQGEVLRPVVPQTIRDRDDEFWGKMCRNPMAMWIDDNVDEHAKHNHPDTQPLSVNLPTSTSTRSAMALSHVIRRSVK